MVMVMAITMIKAKKIRKKKMTIERKVITIRERKRSDHNKSSQRKQDIKEKTKRRRRNLLRNLNARLRIDNNTSQPDNKVAASSDDPEYVKERFKKVASFKKKKKPKKEYGFSICKRSKYRKGSHIYHYSFSYNKYKNVVNLVILFC